MKTFMLCGALFASTFTLAADESPDRLPAETLAEIVSVAQANFEGIEAMAAIYKWNEATPGRPPRDGNVRFAWDQKNDRFRSAFEVADLTSDTITTPTEFVRISPGQQRTSPSADSRRYWSADVLSPARLFGSGDRPLWQRFKTYTTWKEANDRITIDSSEDSDDLTYTIRMAYTGLNNTKVFVTWILSRSNAFNPTLIARSKGTDIATARLIDVTSWTYKTVDSIVVPRSIAVSTFDERTGVPIMQRNLHLRFAKVNDALDESAFDTDVALSIEAPTRKLNFGNPFPGDSEVPGRSNR